MHGHSKYNEEYPTHTKNKFICNQLIKSAYKLMSKADIVTPVSNGTKDFYFNNGLKIKMQVLENTLDFTLLNPTPDTIKEIENKYNFDYKKDNVLVLITRLDTYYKNLDFLLYSLKELKELGTKFKFLLVGCGKDEDKLKKLAEDLDLNDCLTFVVLLDNEKLNKVCENAYKTLNKTWLDKANELLEIFDKLIKDKKAS